MADHEIHVAGWDDWATLRFVCNAGPNTPCHVATDEYGANPQPIDHCNAAEWWGNCSPEELIHGRLVGPPPWPVEVIWTPDGPELRQATPPSDNATKTGDPS